MAALVLAAAHPIVHLNAALNTTAMLLLAVGLYLIKRNHVPAHKWTMLTAFVVSVAFLTCYLWYHIEKGHVYFTHPGPIRIVYYAILATHVPLAMTVPFLAIATIYLGFRATGCCSSTSDMSTARELEGRFRRKHRQLARWTYPIWMYVSITGVIVYAMLYHLWPPGGE